MVVRKNTQWIIYEVVKTFYFGDVRFLHFLGCIRYLYLVGL